MPMRHELIIIIIRQQKGIMSIQIQGPSLQFQSIGSQIFCRSQIYFKFNYIKKYISETLEKISGSLEPFEKSGGS